MPVTTATSWTAEDVRDLVTEPLFATSQVLASGLTRISTSATIVHVPTIGSGTADWHTELEELTDAFVPTDVIECRPKKVGCVELLSNETVSDTSAANMVGRAIVAALSDRVDHAFFVGDGPKGPTGLPGAGGAVVEVAGDPVAGVDAYLDAVGQVESVGATATVIWMNALDWTALSKVKTSDTDARPVLNTQPTGAGARTLLGLDVRTCKYVPQGTAYVADATRLVVVDRQPGSVETDTSAGFTKDGTYVRAIQRIEFAFPENGVVAKIAAA